MNATHIKKTTSFQESITYDLFSYELLAIWLPIVVYWVQCSFYEILMRLEIPFFEQYRIHSPEDRQKRNKVAFGKVLVMVALQHVVQIVLGFGLMKSLDPLGDEIKHQNAINKHTSYILLALIHYGYPQKSAFTIANYIAVHYENYVLPCIQFFIAM